MPPFVRIFHLTAHHLPVVVRWANARKRLMYISKAKYEHSCSAVQPTWPFLPYLTQEAIHPAERSAPSSLGRDKNCGQRTAEPLTQRGLSFSQLPTVESPVLMALLARLGHRLQGIGTFISQVKVKLHSLNQAPLRPAYLLRIPLFAPIPSPEFDAAVLRQFLKPQYLMNIAEKKSAHISQASYCNQTAKQQKTIYFYFSMCTHDAPGQYLILQCRADAIASTFYYSCQKWQKELNKRTVNINKIYPNDSIYDAEVELFKNEHLDEPQREKIDFLFAPKRASHNPYQLKHGETQKKRQI